MSFDMLAELLAELTITTRSPRKTFALGNTLGGLVFEGAVISLSGPLGSGKTLFVQGLARGIDVPDTCYVTSPSYTLINEYPGKFSLYHADLYRLAHPDEIESTGLYDLLHQGGVVAIEWADRVLPEDLAEHLAIHLEIRDDRTRLIRLSAYGQRWNNLLRELEKSMKE